ERRAGESHSGADIHRVTHETIRALDHEFSWRIERRGRAFPDEHERQHAPKRNRRSDRYHDHPRDLRRSGSRGLNNARPRQKPAGQVNQALATLFSVASTTEMSSDFFRGGGLAQRAAPCSPACLRQGERSESVALTHHTLTWQAPTSTLSPGGYCSKTKPIKSAAYVTARTRTNM